MARFDDSQLYARGAATLLASWEEYARGAPDARMEHFDGGAAGVFPAGSERDVYNNAVLELSAGIEPMERVYAAAGIERFAVWVHETSGDVRNELEARGYVVEESNRAMGMDLGDLGAGPRGVDVQRGSLRESLRLNEMPDDFLAGADDSAYRVAIARLDGESAATALAYDHEGDCGIYNVETLEHARRRGLGTAVTVRLLEEARRGGSTTASVQSSAMAVPMFSAIGFRDLGLYLEYVPGGP